MATHGLQGALVLTHVVGDSNWLKKDDVLFIELRRESYIPFFTTAAKAGNDEEYIVNVEDVDTIEAAKKLVGKAVYVKDDILKNIPANSPLLWIGFNMVDKAKGSLGPIADVMQAGQQWLAKLVIEDKEVLVPLVDDFITDINMRSKFIRVDLPEGLIEVYLK